MCSATQDADGVAAVQRGEDVAPKFELRLDEVGGGVGVLDELAAAVLPRVLDDAELHDLDVAACTASGSCARFPVMNRLDIALSFGWWCGWVLQSLPSVGSKGRDLVGWKPAHCRLR